MIHEASPTHELRDSFVKEGGMDLREEGVLLARDGKSSLEEVLRATHSEDDQWRENKGLSGATTSKNSRRRGAA